MGRESPFQTQFQNDLREMFPGIFIIKPETGWINGFPDRLLLYMDKWAALEFKASIDAPPRLHQPHYVELLNRMSYAAFVYPENGQEVLRELQYAFQLSRNARSAFR